VLAELVQGVAVGIDLERLPAGVTQHARRAAAHHSQACGGWTDERHARLRPGADWLGWSGPPGRKNRCPSRAQQQRLATLKPVALRLVNTELRAKWLAAISEHSHYLDQGIISFSVPLDLRH